MQPESNVGPFKNNVSTIKNQENVNQLKGAQSSFEFELVIAHTYLPN